MLQTVETKITMPYDGILFGVGIQCPGAYVSALTTLGIFC